MHLACVDATMLVIAQVFLDHRMLLRLLYIEVEVTKFEEEFTLCCLI